MKATKRRRTNALHFSHAEPELTRPNGQGVIDCAVYIEGRRELGSFTHETALRRVREVGQGFVWLDLHAPDAELMESIAAIFGLHELITEDAISGHQRPKLEAYDDTLVLNLATVRYHEQDVETPVRDIVSTGEVMVILGRDFVLTVRHGDIPDAKSLQVELETAPARLSLGPAAVMHEIADRVVDSYVTATESMGRNVDELEFLVFTPRSAVDIEQIYSVKSELLELKQDILPLALPLRRLSAEHLDLVPRQIRHYFRNILDHHSRVSADVTTLDEQLSALVDAAVAIIGIRQNADMRRISAWVAIAAIPTMIAGIYGMNFHNMPELSLKYGYYVVLGFMIVVCVGLFVLFRKNRWL